VDIGAKLAEVIEASSAEFVAHCYSGDGAPPLGSLVKTRSDFCEIYGVVYNIETHSLDPGRRVIARGEAMETEGDIFKNNPQLAKLLATDLRVLVVGHRRASSLYHYLPPKSAPIHGFVRMCLSEEVEEFTRSLDFLSLIIAARLPVSTDEVIAACLRYAGEAHSDTRSFLVRAGKELARLMGSDTRRLDSVLKRLR